MDDVVSNKTIFIDNPENFAWKKFTSTGSVNDYLMYKFIKNNIELKGLSKIEDPHGRTSRC